MSESTPVTIPRDNVNDEFVKLIEWHVSSGDQVEQGQLLAEVEAGLTGTEVIDSDETRQATEDSGMAALASLLGPQLEAAKKNKSSEAKGWMLVTFMAGAG